MANTEKIYGVVAYTGKFTKMALNSTDAPFKFSKTEKTSNFITLAIFICKVILCCICAVMSGIFAESYASVAFYLGDPVPWYESALSTFLLYFSLFSYFIPISLAVYIGFKLILGYIGGS